MKSLRPLHWPPLVGATNPPMFIRIRDILLTAGAWLLLGYLIRDALVLAWDYFSHPIFELTFTTAPDWQKIGERLAPFALYAGILVSWLSYWGYVSRHHLADASHKPQPPQLGIEEHALSLDFPPAQLRAWQSKRSMVASFDESGRIVSIRDHG